MKQELSLENILARNPDLSSGSSDIYFQDSKVIKILKPSATLYQFCIDCSPSDVLALLERVKQSMLDAFGDMLVATEYSVQQGRIVTTQPKISGKTLKELTDQAPSLEPLNQGIAKLRQSWQEDSELLEYIIDEIVDPSNVIFDEEKLIIIDWL